MFEEALDAGFLTSGPGAKLPFAAMWANRMPRRVLPVKRSDGPIVDPAREVPSDVADFVELIGTIARNYFTRENYLRVDGKRYFSIYDSTFFLAELGLDWARQAIEAARRWLTDQGLGELHLAAIEPSKDAIGNVRAAGFDSVTHYVLLPDWRGPKTQDYQEYATRRAAEWPHFAEASSLPYMPAVAPGWDASPRGADFGGARPDRYPWSPVVVGERPELFREALARAIAFAESTRPHDPIVFIASLNEWSEGHYLEPAQRFGYGG